jgi:hypothetical protein
MLNVEDTLPRRSISRRAANKSRSSIRFYSPAESYGLNAENTKTHPPPPGVTQEAIGFSEAKFKKISKLSKKCNKKPVTLSPKMPIFCTILGAKTANLGPFARILHAPRIRF